MHLLPDATAGLLIAVALTFLFPAQVTTGARDYEILFHGMEQQFHQKEDSKSDCPAGRVDRTGNCAAFQAGPAPPSTVLTEYLCACKAGDVRRIRHLVDMMYLSPEDEQNTQEFCSALEPSLDRIAVAEHELRGTIYSILGRARRHMHQWRESVDCAGKAVEEFKKLPVVSFRLPVALRHLAGVKRECGELENALSFALRSTASSITIADEQSRHRNLAFGNLMIAGIYSDLGNMTRCKHYASLTAAAARKVESVEVRFQATVRAARLLLQYGDLETTGALIDELENLPKTALSTYGLRTFFLIKTDFHLKSGDSTAANNVFAVLECTSEPLVGLSEKWHTIASQIYEIRGDYHLAIQSERIVSLEKAQREARRNEARLSWAASGFKQQIDSNRASFHTQQQVSQSNSIRSLMILTIVFALATTLLSACYFRIDSIRRFQGKMRQEEKNINRQLTQQVHEKSEALVAEIEERAELQRTLDQRQRLEAIGRLTGGVAHDFNNLLQVIITTNDLLKESINQSSQGTASQLELLRSSDNAAAVGATIVQQLLTYSRRQRLVPVSFRPGVLFSSQLKLLQAAAGENVDLKILNRRPEAAICIDPAQLTTSLINLISNASDAIRANGTINIVIDMFDSSDMDRPGQVPGNYVQIDVVDNGTGMTERQIEKACDPFYSTKKPNSGTGLGLSTVYGFAIQSGGDLVINSREGMGTTVSLTFPAVTFQEEDQFDHRQFELPRSLETRAKILLVEDNSMVRTALELKLDSLGLPNQSVASALEAIERLQTTTEFDVVLTDVKMAGCFGGLELRDWVHENRPTTSVILMTGLRDTLEFDGDSPVLHKPFSDDQLISVIRQVCPKDPGGVAGHSYST